jgi:3-dehydroquinate dehydratase I
VVCLGSDKAGTVDEAAVASHHSPMAHEDFHLTKGRAQVVGGFGGGGELEQAEVAAVRAVCDIAEVRLDLLEGGSAAEKPLPWRHLAGVPLLFTARRIEEGGAVPLSAAERMGLIGRALDDASLIDIEVASIPEMRRLIDELTERGLPWIASFHDFKKLPDAGTLADAAKRAHDAGAAAFKAAAFLHDPADIARLAEFQLADHGLPVATMGMGPLAPVSRLLCAQCGSVLNYGYIGETPTAPGQWDAGLLKQAIARLTPFQA